MKRQDGFTLIEMILVVVIISILAAVVIANYSNEPQKTRIAAAKMGLQTIDSSLERYSMDNGAFPTNDQGLKALSEKPISPPIPQNWSKYINTGIIDPWGNEYKYRYPGEHNKESFDIWSMGPDGRDGTEDDITNWVK